MNVRFQNRLKAGKFLAGKLVRHSGRADVIVLGVPRGGVPVGVGLANALGVAFDALPMPALFAAGLAGGSRVVKHPAVASVEVAMAAKVPDAGPAGTRVAAVPMDGGERPAPEIRGRTVILADDGIATGATMRTAVAAMRRGGARFVVVAAPVAARESYLELRQICDELVVVMAPRELGRFGQYFADFSPPTDEELQDLLAREPVEISAGQALEVKV